MTALLRAELASSLRRLGCHLYGHRPVSDMTDPSPFCLRCRRSPR